MKQEWERNRRGQQRLPTTWAENDRWRVNARSDFKQHEGWSYGKHNRNQWPLNKHAHTRNQKTNPFLQRSDQFIPPWNSFRQKWGNERKWGNQVQGQKPIYTKFDRFNFKKIAHKFYRPKQHLQAKVRKAEKIAISPQKLEDHIAYEVTSSIHINNEKWQETIVKLQEKAFFFKWLGPWPSATTIRLGCKAIWGKECWLKTLTNGFIWG